MFCRENHRDNNCLPLTKTTTITIVLKSMGSIECTPVWGFDFEPIVFIRDTLAVMVFADASDDICGQSDTLIGSDFRQNFWVRFGFPHSKFNSI